MKVSKKPTLWSTITALALCATIPTQADDLNIGESIADDIQDDSVKFVAATAGVGALTYLIVVQARKNSEKSEQEASKFEERDPGPYLSLSARKKRELFEAIAYQDLEPQKLEISPTPQGLSIAF